MSVRGGGVGERQRERERISSRLHAECRACRGAQSHHPEISAETKSQMLSLLSRKSVGFLVLQTEKCWSIQKTLIVTEL